MKTIVFLVGVISILLMITFSCGDTIYPENMARRYVYEVSEEDITGHGDYIDITELVGITGTGSEKEMPVVMVYCDEHNNHNIWHPVSSYNYHLEEGKLWIDAENQYADYFRIIIIK